PGGPGGPGGTGWTAGTGASEPSAASQAAPFSRSSPDLPLRAARAVGAWQDHLTRLVQAEDQGPGAKRISFDDESLSLVVLAAMLGEDAPGAAPITVAPVTEDEGTSI